MRNICREIRDGRIGQRVGFTNSLPGPPPGHLVELLVAGNDHPSAADRFVRAIDRFEDFDNFLYDPAKARSCL